MNRRIKVLVAVLATGMLMLGVGVSFAQEGDEVALASTSAPTQEMLVSNSVDVQGVSIDKAEAVVSQACIDTLYELVAQGRITWEQREQCLERIQEGQCQGWGGCLGTDVDNGDGGDRWQSSCCFGEQSKAEPEPRGCCS